MIFRVFNVKGLGFRVFMGLRFNFFFQDFRI